MFKEIQYTMKLVETSIRNRGHQSLLRLVLLDYMPITRVHNGLDQYLFVDMYSAHGDLYFLEERTLKRDAQHRPLRKPIGTLDDLLPIIDEKQNSIARMIDLSGVTEGVNPNTTRTNTAAERFQFQKPQNELFAIMIRTSDFSYIEKAVQGGQEITGTDHFEFLSTIKTRGGLCPRKEWIIAAYQAYMMHINILLADYYYTMQRPPYANEFEQTRVYVLDSYVPLGYKFSGIVNPVLGELDVTDNQLIGSLNKLTKMPIFQKSVKITGIAPITGYARERQLEGSQSFGVYTTRTEIAQLFKLNCEKVSTQRIKETLPIRSAKRTIDFYTPYFYLSMLYYTMLEDLDTEGTVHHLQIATPRLDNEVTIEYTIQEWRMDEPDDKADEDIDSIEINEIWFSPNSSKAADNKKMRIRFSQALMLSYVRKIYKVARYSRARTYTVNKPTKLYEEV